MNKVKKFTFEYKYNEPKTEYERKAQEEAVRRAYGRIFDIALKSLRLKKLKLSSTNRS